MRSINIAKTLLAKRKEKGITQEQLAQYIGVSKASVSKWEKGISYPDITLLPQLATYFNISIDELIDYSPQMTNEEARKLYDRLCKEFTEKPAIEVLVECDKIVKKYYSCFPVLLQMALLYMNHMMLLPKREEQIALIEKAISYCQRIQSECEEFQLQKDALLLEATCNLISNNPQEVLNLLGEDIRPIDQTTELIAQAYLKMGDMKKSGQIIQLSIYQHLLAFISSSVTYLGQCGSDIKKSAEIIKRTEEAAKIYDLEELNPNGLLQLYLTGAAIYTAHGMMKEAVELLERYTAIACNPKMQFELHGDSFFDQMEEIFPAFDLYHASIRDHSFIKVSMLAAIKENPAFQSLHEMQEYKLIVKRLELNIKEDSK